MGDADIVDSRFDAKIGKELVDRLRAKGLDEQTVNEVCQIASLIAQRQFNKFCRNLEKRLKKHGQNR